jgi:Domain of unknown function (DUF4351)/Putative transposase, YhgA-like
MTNSNEINNLTETSLDRDETFKNPQTKYDSPWKDIIEIYFKEFMKFFFSTAYYQIDWTKKIEFLDKELQEVTADAEIGRRYADKLVKVYLKNGKEEWILIHIEVQSQEEGEFAMRMFIYNYRIFDKYKKTVASLAILGDDNTNWRPSSFGYSLFECSLNFEFPAKKLLDYQQRLSELENSDNPFATVVLSHLAALNTTRDRSERKVQKLALVRRLYDKGFDGQYVINLLRFIDWMLTLPPDIEAEFKLELKQLEVGRRMRYVTTFERDARQQGVLSVVTRLLNRRLGNIDEAISERVRSLSTEELEELSEALLDFTSVTDLTDWLSRL